MTELPPNEVATLREAGANFSPLAPGTVSPEVSADALAEASDTLQALQASRPELDAVVRALAVVPYAALRWLHHPNPELDAEGSMLSPLEWLDMGGDISVVADSARELHVS